MAVGIRLKSLRRGQRPGSFAVSCLVVVFADLRPPRHSAISVAGADVTTLASFQVGTDHINFPSRYCSMVIFSQTSLHCCYANLPSVRTLPTTVQRLLYSKPRNR